MKIYQASAQWANRPSDERYWSVAELLEESKRIANASAQALVRYGDLRVEAKGSDLFLEGNAKQSAKVCHWAFGQMAQRIKAPQEYLRRLPPSLAAQNINYGLARRDLRDPEDEAKLLLHRTEEGLVARCFTSGRYQRIWNWEIASSLRKLEVEGWRTPPARPSKVSGERVRKATEADVLEGNRLGLSINVGDDIGPAGVYASDRDMFVFLIDDKHVVENPLPGGVPLARGFFCWNSEVGDKTFGITTFLYEAICGNHIVWGASNVKEIKMKHIGQARSKAFFGLKLQLREYAESSVSDIEASIKRTQEYQIAATKEEVIEQLLAFGKKRKFQAIRESEIRTAYSVAEATPRYGNPRTPWAITQGLTQISQLCDYAEDRVKVDKEASSILEMAF